MCEIDTEAIIQAASERDLTDEEADQLAAWASQFQDDRGIDAATHPLFVFVTTFVRRTRPTMHFDANFKRVRPVAAVVGHLVQTLAFEQQRHVEEQAVLTMTECWRVVDEGRPRGGWGNSKA